MPHHTSGATLLSQGQEHGYVGSSQSPVPTLTNTTSRSSSASSSVNSLSPDGPDSRRDLLHQFHAVGDMNPEGYSQNAKKRYYQELEDNQEYEAAELPKKIKIVHETGAEANQQQQAPKAQQRRAPLTGSENFVKRFGLYNLYNEYVRPYTGGDAQAVPDLASSYLADVASASVSQPPQSSQTLRELVLMPSKNELDVLEALPLSSIRSAFSIGSLKQPAADDAHSKQHSGVSGGGAISSAKHHLQRGASPVSPSLLVPTRSPRSTSLANRVDGSPVPLSASSRSNAVTSPSSSRPRVHVRLSTDSPKANNRSQSQQGYGNGDSPNAQVRMSSSLSSLRYSSENGDKNEHRQQQYRSRGPSGDAGTNPARQSAVPDDDQQRHMLKRRRKEEDYEEVGQDRHRRHTSSHRSSSRPSPAAY